MSTKHYLLTEELQNRTDRCAHSPCTSSISPEWLSNYIRVNLSVWIIPNCNWMYILAFNKYGIVFGQTINQPSLPSWQTVKVFQTQYSQVFPLAPVNSMVLYESQELKIGI